MAWSYKVRWKPQRIKTLNQTAGRRPQQRFPGRKGRIKVMDLRNQGWNLGCLWYSWYQLQTAENWLKTRQTRSLISSDLTVHFIAMWPRHCVRCCFGSSHLILWQAAAEGTEEPDHRFHVPRHLHLDTTDLTDLTSKIKKIWRHVPRKLQKPLQPSFGHETFLGFTHGGQCILDFPKRVPQLCYPGICITEQRRPRSQTSFYCLSLGDVSAVSPILWGSSFLSCPFAFFGIVDVWNQVHPS